MARGLGAGVLGILLVVHLAGLVRLPTQAAQPPTGITKEERAVLDYASHHKLQDALIEVTDGTAMRLTLFSDERTIFLNPHGFSNRIERYKRLFKERKFYTLVIPGKDNPSNRIGRPPDDRFDRFVVYKQVPQPLIMRVYGDGFLR